MSIPEELKNLPNIEQLHPDAYDDFIDCIDWVEEARPTKFIEYNEENSQEVQKLDARYVATSHGTCDGDNISTGFHDFGPNPRCCWDTYGWYICENEYPEDVYHKENAYLPCTKCNPDGEDEVENEEPCSQCEAEGWMTYYFDNYFDTLKYAPKES